MTDLWQVVPASIQNIVVFLLLLLPGILLGFFTVRGYRPRQLVLSLLVRYRWLNLLFVTMIAISVGVGIALLVQEKALRSGTAKAAEKFDLIVSAPGSKIDMLMAAVYLQPVDVPLLDGKIMNEISDEPQVALAAPIGFGDSYHNYPIIGSTARFVTYLSGKLTKGRIFASPHEVVVGAGVPVQLGETFTPVHGHGEEVADDVHSLLSEQNRNENKAKHSHSEGESKVRTHIHHHNFKLTVVGKMAITNSPWDKAIIEPIESIWLVHGLGSGHKPGDTHLGVPFDPEYFPGTPAILIHAKKIWANYALASKYTTSTTMAFFPGAILSRLHALLGDVRQAMSLLATLTEILVAISVFACLIILARLFSRHFALLRAVGAPGRFIIAVMWSYTMVLVSAGSIAGFSFGFILSHIFASIVTKRTNIAMQIRIDWIEFQHVAAFFSMALLLALLPAWIAYRNTKITDLRGAD